MKRLAILLLSAALPIVGLRAGAVPPADPWTAYRRGNELLQQARQAGTKADPALLVQAEEQYRACLAREGATPDAGTLFDDARYNLELTKLLLTQVGRPEKKSQGVALGYPVGRLRRPDAPPRRGLTDQPRATPWDNAEPNTAELDPTQTLAQQLKSLQCPT